MSNYYESTYLVLLSDLYFNRWFHQNQSEFPGISMKDMVCLYDVYYSDEESFLRTASTISIKYKNREDVLYQFVMESAEFLEWLRIRFVNIDKLRKRDAIELFLGWANTKTYTYNTWMIEQTSI